MCLWHLRVCCVHLPFVSSVLASRLRFFPTWLVAVLGDVDSAVTRVSVGDVLVFSFFSSSSSSSMLTINSTHKYHDSYAKHRTRRRQFCFLFLAASVSLPVVLSGRHSPYFLVVSRAVIDRLIGIQPMGEKKEKPHLGSHLGWPMSANSTKFWAIGGSRLFDCHYFLNCVSWISQNPLTLSRNPKPIQVRYFACLGTRINLYEIGRLIKLCDGQQRIFSSVKKMHIELGIRLCLKVWLFSLYCNVLPLR